MSIAVPKTKVEQIMYSSQPLQSCMTLGLHLLTFERTAHAAGCGTALGFVCGTSCHGCPGGYGAGGTDHGREASEAAGGTKGHGRCCCTPVLVCEGLTLAKTFLDCLAPMASSKALRLAEDLCVDRLCAGSTSICQDRLAFARLACVESLDESHVEPRDFWASRQ